MCWVEIVDIVGQEDREAMSRAGVAFRECCHGSRNASAGGDTQERAGGTRRKHDHTVAIPCAATAIGRITHSVCAGPPAMPIFFSLPCAKNPRYAPSGDQNG